MSGIIQIIKGFLSEGADLLGGMTSVDVALEWNKVALDVNIMDHNGPAGSTDRRLYLIAETAGGDGAALTNGPPGSARALAMIHLAMFEAYLCVAGKYMSYYADTNDPIDCSGYEIIGTSLEVAVAQAAHGIMNGVDIDAMSMPGLYGHNVTIMEFVDDALDITMARETDAGRLGNAMEAGKKVAMRILVDRDDDGYSVNDPYLTDVTYTPTGEPGDHDVDPVNPGQGFLGPGAGQMTPFGMTQAELIGFRAPAPPGLTGEPGSFILDQTDPAYVASLLQVKEYGKFRGGDKVGDPFPEDETYDIGNFWSANGSPKTGTPTNLYNDIARKIAIEMGNDFEDNIFLFTKINLAIANAAISTWDSKFYWRLWRPVLAIQNYPEEMMIEESEEGDGPVRRALTTDPIRDEDWTALGASRSNGFEGEHNFSPPFPGHTSGHATFGCTVFQTLANFYGTYDIPFEYTSVEWNGVTKDQFGRVRPCRKRQFNSLIQAMAENAASRVFNGVHFDFEGGEGCTCGMNIANYVWDNLLPGAVPINRQMMTADVEVANAIKDILANSQTSGYQALTCDAGTPPYPYVEQ